MVRPEPWNVTATLENAGIVDAHGEVFGRKPLHPPLSHYLRHVLGARGGLRSSLTLKNESYWKTVIAFSKAYSVELVRGNEFEEARMMPWSEPQGPCIVSAGVENRDNKVEVTIGIHLEPGFKPIRGSITNLIVRTSEGTQVPGMSEQRWFRFSNRQLIPTACEYKFPLLTQDNSVSISGKAMVILPTKVEGISWTVDEWKSQPTKELAGCQVTLKDWDIGIAFKPTIEENPDPSRDYADRAWVYLSDDAGRTSNNMSFGLFGKGYGESGGSSGWPDDDLTYRRVCVIRVVDADAIEFQFEIKDIPLPKKRDD